MSNSTSKKPLIRVTILKSLTFLMFIGFILMGCEGTVKQSLPQMGANAVPSLALDDRPTLDLSDEEILAVRKASISATGKILKNQAAWTGYADIADAAVQGYRDYIKNVFGGDKAKKKAP